MTSTVLTLVLGLIALAAFAGRLIYLYDKVRDRASDLARMATGGASANPFSPALADFHDIFVRDQREFGASAERSRRNRCPSAPLSMRERWVITALDDGEGPFQSIANIARSLAMKPDVVGLILRVLKDAGYVTLAPVYRSGDEDTLAGRGYVLTASGMAVKAAIQGERSAKLERGRNSVRNPAQTVLA